MLNSTNNKSVHLILGTAGHVDHGKTSLIKALTNVDCDTSAEEKKRGITINLGFTHIDLNQNLAAGIVDVPGHKDFVNTMIAGASAINMAMLVIAADEGIMPQTVEHLNIMQLLNIKHGFIALTKADKVSDYEINQQKQSIKKLCQNTFLQNANIIACSSKTGAGIDEIKNQLITFSKNIQTTSSKNCFFRMYIDRVFSFDGIGKIATGSVLSGSLTTNNELFILPAQKPVRVKALHKHNSVVNLVQADDRCAINFASKFFVKKSMQLSTVNLPVTNLIDCQIYNFSPKKIKLWQDVIFLSGSFKTKAKMHLINCNELLPSKKAIAQIKLSTPNSHICFDRFILRDSSNTHTLGGGYIFDTMPNLHKRRPTSLINILKEKSSLTGLSAILFTLKQKPMRYSDIIKMYNPNQAELLNKLVSNPNFISFDEKNEKLFYNEANFKELCKKFGKQNLAAIEKEIQPQFKILAKHIVAYNLSHNKSVQCNKTERLIIDFLSNNQTALQTFDDIAKITKVNKNILFANVKQLDNKNLIIKAENYFFTKEFADSILKTVLNLLINDENGITVSMFKTAINSNRKMALAFLAYFEKEKILLRQNDVRILTQKGKKLSLS